METFQFKITTPDIAFPENFSVEAPDQSTAQKWAQTVFANRVKWWLLAFSDAYQVFNDLRKPDHFTSMPQSGITDEAGNVVWPDGEARDSFTCSEGKFILTLV